MGTTHHGLRRRDGMEWSASQVPARRNFRPITHTTTRGVSKRRRVPVDLDARLRLYADGDVLRVMDTLKDRFTHTRDLVEALQRFETQLRHDVDRLSWKSPTH